MMNKEVCDFVTAKTKELIASPTCSSEARAAAEAWLAAVGTELEAAESKKYLAELEADIMPIDQLIGFAQSAEGQGYFGAETAEGIVAHAQAIKAAGAKYCDCPACLAVAAILEKKEEILS